MTHTQLKALSDWSLLVATLSPTKGVVELPTEDSLAARRLCDGFGRTENPDLLWDWSHVRDSSKLRPHRR